MGRQKQYDLQVELKIIKIWEIETGSKMPEAENEVRQGYSTGNV